MKKNRKYVTSFYYSIGHLSQDNQTSKREWRKNNMKENNENYRNI